MVGGGLRVERGKGIRAGLCGCCNLPTGTWERASPSPFFIQINSRQDLLLLFMVIRIVNVQNFCTFGSFLWSLDI